jgi:hypothetical protein
MSRPVAPAPPRPRTVSTGYPVSTGHLVSMGQPSAVLARRRRRPHAAGTGNAAGNSPQARRAPRWHRTPRQHWAPCLAPAACRRRRVLCRDRHAVGDSHPHGTGNPSGRRGPAGTERPAPPRRPATRGAVLGPARRRRRARCRQPRAGSGIAGSHGGLGWGGRLRWRDSQVGRLCPVLAWEGDVAWGCWLMVVASPGVLGAGWWGG